jgi:hypothetical protein
MSADKLGEAGNHDLSQLRKDLLLEATIRRKRLAPKDEWVRRQTEPTKSSTD